MTTAPPPAEAAVDLRVMLDSRDLLVGALRQAADTRKRAATKAALEVAKIRAAGNDPRAAAVRVVAVMAEAANLEAYADTLADLEPTAAPPPPPPAPTKPAKPARKTTAKKTAPAKETAAMPDLNPPAEPGEAPPVDLDQLADDAGLTDTVIEENGREHGLDEDEPTPDEVAGNVDTIADALTP